MVYQDGKSPTAVDRGGLVFKAHRLVYLSALGSRVINEKRRVTDPASVPPWFLIDYCRLCTRTTVVVPGRLQTQPDSADRGVCQDSDHPTVDSIRLGVHQDGKFSFF